MKVTVDVGHSEYIIEFSQINNETNGDGNYWKGMTPEALEDRVWVQFYEKDGQITKIERSTNVTTSGNVLYERIQEAFNIERESHISDIEPEDESISDTEPSPYDPNKIKVRRDIYSIREIFIMMEQDKSIDLNPEFQRYFVWDNSQKSQFIESLLLGLPIPLFYFAENEDLTYNVVDGLQRLTTLRQYMRNDFPIKGIERLGKDLNGKYFKPDEKKRIAPNKALPAPMVRRIEGTQLVINVIEASSPPQVKFDIFQRINSGGKHLNNQEIRNCIATPSTRRMLHEMVHNDLFKIVTGNSVSERRMDDQELALRFIGFSLVYNSELEYNGNMTYFLNNLIGVLNKFKEKELQKIVHDFHISLHNCWHLFGEFAFRKCLPEHLLPGARRQAINKLLFTAWTVVLSNRDIREEIQFGRFATIQAEKLENKGEFYQNITNRTNDRNIIERVFKEVEFITFQNIYSLNHKKAV